MERVEIDNRGLEPPEPMVRILNTLAENGRETQVLALMDREPLFLYPELERRGYEWEIEPAEDGHYVLLIRAAGNDA